MTYKTRFPCTMIHLAWSRIFIPPLTTRRTFLPSLRRTMLATDPPQKQHQPHRSQP